MVLIRTISQSVLWMIAFATVLTHPGFLLQGAQRTRPDLVRTVGIPATDPWTDTGILLRTGDHLQIRAWGTVKVAAAATGIGPQGSGTSDGGCTYVVTERRVRARSLVGNVAQELTFDGSGFYVGASWAGTLPIEGASTREGRLLLGFNDSNIMCDRSGYDSWAFRNNNSGAFTAEISVKRAP